MSKLLKPLAIAGLGVLLILTAAEVWLRTGREGTRSSRPRSDFHSISAALKTYKINAGHYPSTEQGLRALVDRPTIPPFPEDWVKIAERIPTDPWKNEYRYRCLPEGSPHPFELISNGPDGIEGTKDDRSLSDGSH